jgi:hypothetical protein
MASNEPAADNSLKPPYPSSGLLNAKTHDDDGCETDHPACEER